jgi:rubrerythrin
MPFESIDDIIAYALEREEEAVAFYADLSKKETFSGAKEVFEEFSREEQKHVDLLKNFSDDKEKLAGYKFEWIPDMKRSNYMVDIVYEEGMHYLDILRLAMKREEKALQLYNDLQGKTDDAEFVKLFKMLAQEEAKHKRALETIYDDAMAEMGD